MNVFIDQRTGSASEPQGPERHVPNGEPGGPRGPRLLKQRDERDKFRYEIRTGFEEIERRKFEEYDGATTKDLAGDIIAAGKARLPGLAKKKTGTK